MGFLNAKELRKKRFSFRKSRKSKDPPGEGVPKKSIQVEEVETPKTIAEDESPSVSSGSASSSHQEQSHSVSGGEEESADFVKTPIKNLLGDLNVVEDDEEEATELVLGEIPRADPDEIINNESPASGEAAAKIPCDPEEMSTDGGALSRGAPDADEDDDGYTDDDEPERNNAPEKRSERRGYTGPVDLDDEEFPDDENMSTLSRDPVGKVEKEAKKADPPAIVSPDDDDDRNVKSRSFSSNAPDATSAPDAPEERAIQEEDDEASWAGPEGTARKLLGVFNCVEDTACIPETVMETACDDACAPIGSKPEKRGVKRNLSFYSDQFAVKFLDELLNVGFALIHHVPAEDGDWSGRSATMILRPGTCNAEKSIPPSLEWTAMGGGTQTSVETKSISLLNIHSVTASNIEIDEDDDEDDNIEENEELQCLFTVTTTDGVVEVFEAISADETARLVTGIKNLSSRFSSQLIAGDIRAFADFYSQHGEGEDIKLTAQEAMVRLSHSFFDA